MADELTKIKLIAYQLGKIARKEGQVRMCRLKNAHVVKEDWLRGWDAEDLADYYNDGLNNEKTNKE